MTKQENFETLKSDAIKHYTNYINVIKEFSYEDLNDLKKRLLLVETYHKSVSCNAEYRDFINRNKLNQRLKENNFTPPPQNIKQLPEKIYCYSLKNDVVKMYLFNINKPCNVSLR